MVPDVCGTRCLWQMYLLPFPCCDKGRVHRHYDGCSILQQKTTKTTQTRYGVTLSSPARSRVPGAGVSPVLARSGGAQAWASPRRGWLERGTSGQSGSGPTLHLLRDAEPRAGSTAGASEACSRRVCCPLPAARPRCPRLPPAPPPGARPGAAPWSRRPRPGGSGVGADAAPRPGDRPARGGRR